MGINGLLTLRITSTMSNLIDELQKLSSLLEAGLINRALTCQTELLGLRAAFSIDDTPDYC